ncbi:uncharacterized protein LOC144649629 [Oculina patagonica]
MRHIHHALLHTLIIVCWASYKAFGASLGTTSGTFKISDNGVQGQGAYTISNGTVEIGLKLLIRTISSTLKDKATATITSLPPNRLGPSSPSGASNPLGTSGSSGASGATGASATSAPSAPLAPSAPSAPSSPSGAFGPSSPQVTTGPGAILTPEDNQFINDMVAIHNELRSVHFSPPIQNNTDMSIAAKQYAQVLAKEKDLRHSSPLDRPQQGESLAMGCTTAAGEGITAKEAITKWYDEACCHNFSIHGFQNISGHFSQLVWKATEEIGVGRAFGTKWGMNCTFIVARYKPKGNINSEALFKENVERGTFDPMAYNCSAVDCTAIAEEKSQAQDSVGNQLQDNRIPDKSRNVGYQNVIPKNKEPQRYNNFNYRSSPRFGNVLGYQGSHGYIKIPEYNSKQLGTSNEGNRVSQYNREEGRQRYISTRLNQDKGRPRSIVYRAKTPPIRGIKVL